MFYHSIKLFCSKNKKLNIGWTIKITAETAGKNLVARLKKNRCYDRKFEGEMGEGGAMQRVYEGKNDKILNDKMSSKMKFYLFIIPSNY